MTQFERSLQLLQQEAARSTLGGIRRGIEKEALRVNSQGKLAQTEHPETLGSALTHPHITTDFSEALLEFITPPCDSISEAFNWLEEIHSFTCQQIQQQQECLWASSMPCILERDKKIPIAQYGNSNVGKMKTIYRNGLGHRYGRAMQTISGIHYNFSLPDSFWKLLADHEGSQQSLQDFKTRRYFDLIRNFQRYFWLLLYLFGAAPAVCKSFVHDRKHNLEAFGENSFYHPYATSLRMGNLGYQSNAQAELVIDYNSLQGYIDSLLGALTTSHPDYEAIGVCENGNYKQLNTNILQIENEFYSTIRPKRVTQSGETPFKALYERGVEYIEVRSVDVNPFHPLGIEENQARFIEVFLLYCLLHDSPETSLQEYRQMQENQHLVVNQGRDPNIKIWLQGESVLLREAGKQVLEEISQVAKQFDEFEKGNGFSESVIQQQKKIDDDGLTPSGKIISLMRNDDQAFYTLAMGLSQQHSQYFAQQSIPAERQQYFETVREDSLQKQQQIEAQDELTLEGFLENYFNQYKLDR